MPANEDTVKIRVLIADFFDGSLSSGQQKAVLKALNQDPALAREFAELYADHLALKILYAVDEADEFVDGVCSVTRWSGQAGQFVAGVEKAVAGRQPLRRRSRRPYIYLAAVAAFAAVCVIAFLNREPTGKAPMLVGRSGSGGVYVERFGFSYRAGDGLQLRRGDVIRTEPAQLVTLRFPDGVQAMVSGGSEILIPRLGRDARQPAALLKRGQMNIEIINTGSDGRANFWVNTADATIAGLSVGTRIELATSQRGARVRVASGSARVGTENTTVSRAATLVAGQETVTSGPDAYVPKQARVMDEQWIAALDPVLWLDAGHWESLVLDDKNRLERWHDRSRMGSDFFQPNPEMRPHLQGNEQNGWDAVGMRHYADTLRGIRPLRAATIMVVCRPLGTPTQFAGLLGSLGDFGIRHTGNRRWYGQAGTAANDGDFGGAAGSHTWVNGRNDADGQFGVSHLVTVERSTVATLHDPILGTYFKLNGYPEGARGFTGMICEVLAFDRCLTGAERARLESHLMVKWGLAPANWLETQPPQPYTAGRPDGIGAPAAAADATQSAKLPDGNP